MGGIGYPDLLLLKMPKDSELRQPVEAIKQSGIKASEVVADLLTVARGIAAKWETANLNDLSSDYLNSPEGQKLQSLHTQVSIVCQYEPQLLNISCSPVHIKKCIMNLVGNAAESIATKGTITLSTYNLDINQKTATDLTIEPGPYAVLKISDDGSGINKSDINHIFEPFYTKKTMGRSGTGLGLTVVWNTVQDHQGAIHVVSNSAGTTFELRFPATTGQVLPDETENPSSIPRGNGEQILLVDDEHQQRIVGRLLLESLGYNVETAVSGEDAIHFIKNNSVDLLMLDMLMEPGMNGRRTYEKILEIHPDQKAIIASGLSKSDDVKATLELGAAVFIGKPYSRGGLAHAVRQGLES